MEPKFPALQEDSLPAEPQRKPPRGWLKGNSNFLSFNTIMNMCNPANTQDTKSLGLHLGQAGPQEVSLQITPSLLPV